MKILPVGLVAVASLISFGCQDQDRALKKSQEALTEQQRVNRDQASELARKQADEKTQLDRETAEKQVKLFKEHGEDHKDLEEKSAELRRESQDKQTDLNRKQKDTRTEMQKDQSKDLTYASKNVVDNRNNLSAEQRTTETDFTARLSTVDHRLTELDTLVANTTKVNLVGRKMDLIHRKELLEESTDHLGDPAYGTWMDHKSSLEKSIKKLETDVALLDHQSKNP